MPNEETSLEERRERLEELQDSVNELSDSIYDVGDLESTSIAIDLIASKLSVFSGKEFVGSAAAFFTSFADHGLDAKVVSCCTDIEKYASENLYDDNEYTEGKLEDADAAREFLHDELSSLVDSFEQKLKAEEAESDPADGEEGDDEH